MILKPILLGAIGVLSIVLGVVILATPAPAQGCNNSKHHPISCAPGPCTILETICDAGDPNITSDDKYDYLMCSNEDSGGYCNDYENLRFCYPTTNLECNKFFSCGVGCGEFELAGCSSIPRANKGACPTPP